jgi:hypothetical protein
VVPSRPDRLAAAACRRDTGLARRSRCTPAHS